MKPNYDPYKHFCQVYEKEIKEQFKTIFDLKANDAPKYPLYIQHTTIKTDMSDNYAVIRHFRNMFEIVKISDLFEGREVIDVGVGFGGSYYPIKFGNPKKIIAIDPFEENIELARKLGYDECQKAGWEEANFPAGSVVFLRGTWLPDFEPFLKKLQEHNVCDIVIIQSFLTLESDYTYRSITNFVTEDIISRWSYDRPIVLCKVPTIGELIRLARAYNYGLMMRSSSNRDGQKVYKKGTTEQYSDYARYTLHFSKIGE